MTEFKHIITSEDDGQEIKQILKKHFDFSSRLRNRIKRNNLLTLNGKDTEGWHRVKTGDIVSIILPDEESHFMPQAIPLDIVYEDDDIMLINKQAGLIVHPTKGHPVGTVANALAYYMQEQSKKWKIRFVNRLDMDTSGLLLIAKNAYCQNDISNQMHRNQISKKYIAIVKGIIEEESGTVDMPIGRPDLEDVRRGVMTDGAPSITHYKVIEHLKGHSLIELILETGRTHQIRVHMSYIGHPVLGDHLYGGENVNLMERQALHAVELSFNHPITKLPVNFKAPVPEDMLNAIDHLRN